MSPGTKRIVQIVGPILILGAGVGLATLLYASREEPEQSAPEDKSVLVETVEVQRKEHRLDVRVQGTVTPAREIRLTPQVSGRLVYVNENLVTGGLVREGERLAQIDRSDYQLTVEQRKTELAQAQANLEIEQGQQAIAKKEWELFKDQVGTDELDSSLALRKPQLTQARARIDAAKANLQQAKLNLRRTSIEAPFNAVVREESTEVGQLVGTQTSIATLVGTDAFWVRASVPVERIPDISIPGVNAGEGSRVDISYSIGRKTIRRQGEVIRLQSDLDPQGRMARILIAIDDPLQLKELAPDERTDPNAGQRGVPMLLDAYVDAHIRGRRTEQLIEVPRRAVRNGDQVFVVGADNKLTVETIEIAARRPASLLVRSGVNDGDRLVTSPIATPVEGMELKLASQTSENRDAETKPDDPNAGPDNDSADDPTDEASESTDAAQKGGNDGSNDRQGESR